MRGRCRLFLLLSPWLALAGAAVAPAGATAATLHATRITAINATPLGADMARTADGTLHLVYSTQTAWGAPFDGIGSTSISPSGHVSSQVQALTGWKTTEPGLVVMPGGTLTAVFGGDPDVGGTAYSGPWDISSTDGGSSWSAPVDVGSHQEDFGGDITAQLSNGSPVLTVSAAGGTQIQTGFGTGSPTAQLGTPQGQPIGGVGTALDKKTGAVVASWFSNAAQGSLWMQEVSPGFGPAQEIAGNLASWGDQQRQLSVASLDNGPGVFTAFSPDGKHVRLLRYGGTSIALPAVQRVAPAEVDVATGPDGRLWVMWGDVKGPDSRLAVTRSNKARTSFEPTQVFAYEPNVLSRLYGDGRLGPLDLLVNMTPNVPAGQPLVSGIFAARVLPVLSASVSVHKSTSDKFNLGVKVTDASDPVSGAGVSAKGLNKKTGPFGTAKLKVSGVSGSKVTVTIAAPGYRALSRQITL